MTRKEAIESILKGVEPEDIIISSTGMTSRELYNIKDRPLNFYMMGSMGNALAIGLGIAINTSRKVIVINGDGSALMSLGTMVQHNNLHPKNLYHAILDNNAHNSTGGQSTISDKIDFETLSPNTYRYDIENKKVTLPRIPFSPKEIKERFETRMKAKHDRAIASILIPVFKREELLKWGLKSLSKQECPYPFEILVLNDGIKDNTEKICDEFRDKLNIRYIFTGKRNEEKIVWRCPGFCLNIGVRKAKTNYIILTCAEIFHLDKFAVKKTIEKLQNDRKILVRPKGKDDMKGEFLSYIQKTNGKVKSTEDFSSLKTLQTHLPFFLGMHKEEFMCIGGYDEDLVGWAYDDTDLIGRLNRYGCKHVYIDSEIVHLYHPRHRLGIEDNRERHNYNKKIYEAKGRSGVVYSNKDKIWGEGKMLPKPVLSKGWNLKKIPKIAHFYWGNDTLPYLRYLSLLSFCRYNSDWEVNLYVPEKKYKGPCLDTQKSFQFIGDDYFPNVRNIKQINIKSLNDKFISTKCRGLDKAYLSRAEVYKSDFLRWKLLSTVGGFWSDMDIMYFKSMNEMEINKYANRDVNTVISLHPKYKHSVGFMLSAPNNPYYHYIYEKSQENFNPKEYQSIGVTLLNPEFPDVKSIDKRFPGVKTINIPISTVYAYNALIIPTIYNYRNLTLYDENSIGLHWYGGHHLAKDYINVVNHKNYSLYNNVLCKTIAKVYGTE